MTQVKATLFYIRSLFFPINLAIEHDMVEASGIVEPAVLFSLVIILLILLFAIYVYRRLWVVSFGIFWFFIVHLPETILPLNLIVNEHRVYLPGVGFALIVGFLFHGLSSRIKTERSKVLLAGLIILFISLNAYGTIKRNEIWKDEITLWQDAVNKYPQNESAYHSLGKGYMDEGLLDKALKEYQRAIELDPAYQGVHYNLGNLYTQLGRLDEAIDEYTIALILDPTDLDAHNNLGLVFYQMGRYDEAASHYKSALAIEPDNARVHYNLANIYRKKGLVYEAMHEYREVLRFERDHFGAYNNIGVLYGMEGDYDKAVRSFARALEISPYDKDTRYNLGFVYMRMGDCKAAKVEFKYLLETDPDDIRAQRYLDECDTREGIKKGK